VITSYRKIQKATPPQRLIILKKADNKGVHQLTVGFNR
jgi:hypothetical protein